MDNNNSGKNLYFKWDIAISLCKQDVEFARKLISFLNPSLKVFFYEDNQDELISKSGPEAFADIFKSQSRVVLILSRKEWSNSFYTEIERNAIIDRLATQKEGYQFLFVIPMMLGELPTWYPTTRIYADTQRFSLEEIAKFIEFKVTELGGTINPITVEEKYSQILDQIRFKKELISSQKSKDGLEKLFDEIKSVKRIFNNKSAFLREKSFLRISWFDFKDDEYSKEAYLEYGNFKLICKLNYPKGYDELIFSTQDISVSFELLKFSTESEVFRKIVHEKRLLFYRPESTGWALAKETEILNEVESSFFFQSKINGKYYDLVETINTQTFVDTWFQRLLQKSVENIKGMNRNSN